MADEWEEEYLDSETGEKKKRRVPREQLLTDAETGEPEVQERVVRSQFQVPRSSWREQQQQQQQEKGGRRWKIRKRMYHSLYWRKQEIRSNVVKEFLLCNRRVTPIVFMLPTLLICPAWATLLCLLGEACMHIWSHKRNRKRKNVNIEYRSPFHLFSSHFCVYCRSQKWMEKISQIQDKRNLRRRILYPNVVNRVT